MKIGIVGRPQVGKTTVFNILAQSNAEIGGYTSRGQINLSTANVPDERLAQITKISESKKTTPATIDYVDVAGVTKTDMEQAELDSGMLSELRTVDALAHVVRLFEDERFHTLTETLTQNAILKASPLSSHWPDFQIVEGRLTRLRKQFQNQKLPEQLSEIKLLEACQKTLEAGKPLRISIYLPMKRS